MGWARPPKGKTFPPKLNNALALWWKPWWHRWQGTAAILWGNHQRIMMEWWRSGCKLWVAPINHKLCQQQWWWGRSGRNAAVMTAHKYKGDLVSGRWGSLTGSAIAGNYKIIFPNVYVRILTKSEHFCALLDQLGTLLDQLGTLLDQLGTLLE